MYQISLKFVGRSVNKKLITDVNKTIRKRYICKGETIDNIYMKRDTTDQVKKDLNNFLKEESPLKGFSDCDHWATTPYPEGTIFADDKKSHAKIDPEMTSIILFPGQGNQYVGMSKNLFIHSVVVDMFDAASSILGYDLKKLCLEGPKNKLDRTEYCQPATVVCSLAAVEELKEKYPLALSNCAGAAGFSVGELTALVFAGCINFEQAIHLTKIRAEAMQACSQAISGGMMTVLCGVDSDLKAAMRSAKQECTQNGIEDPVCIVANYLIPECKVLAGHLMGLNYIKDNAAKFKIRKVSKLPVSGAFHTRLMKEAAVPFKAALQKIDIKHPLVPIISNVTGVPYKGIAEIYQNLPKQIYSPVKWEQTMSNIYDRPKDVGYPHTYECGPGKSLTVILNRLYSRAGKNCHNVFA